MCKNSFCALCYNVEVRNSTFGYNSKFIKATKFGGGSNYYETPAFEDLVKNKLATRLYKTTPSEPTKGIIVGWSIYIGKENCHVDEATKILKDLKKDPYKPTIPLETYETTLDYFIGKQFSKPRKIRDETADNYSSISEIIDRGWFKQFFKILSFDERYVLLLRAFQSYELNKIAMTMDTNSTAVLKYETSYLLKACTFYQENIKNEKEKANLKSESNELKSTIVRILQQVDSIIKSDGEKLRAIMDSVPSELTPDQVQMFNSLTKFMESGKRIPTA